MIHIIFHVAMMTLIKIIKSKIILHEGLPSPPQFTLKVLQVSVILSFGCSIHTISIHLPLTTSSSCGIENMYLLE